tara:strand:- start:1200 stop:1751 length:552 start_codon:yes stop_codon:yes gene_type:complete
VRVDLSKKKIVRIIKRMGEKLHKDILFYSNLDEYSNKIVQELSTKKEKDNFIYICVDDPNIQLPSFLTAVPTVYLVKDQKILMDEKVQSFIADLGKPKFDDVGRNGDLDAYFSPSNSFSSSYSCLDNSLEKAENSLFSYLEGADNSSIKPSSSLNQGIKSQTNDAFEKLANERKNDFAGIQRI